MAADENTTNDATPTEASEASAEVVAEGTEETAEMTVTGAEGAAGTDGADGAGDGVPPGGDGGDGGGEPPADDPSIVPVRIEDEMRSSYMDYAMSVIIGRALPDVRDGLKPVHRRILYAMYEQGNSYNRAYKKSARIVGDVIGKYHPHGDSAVYDALVRMAQPFSMRVPLVDGQGNFGSVDGDAAAAMRYTEVRMTRACSELLADIEKETVDFGPNYDGKEQEPLVLPTRIPNLLVNGSEGIAVGMATRIPPHNLGEIVSGVLHLIDNPGATLDDLMRFIPGPDFPTHGFLYRIDGIRSAYETGRGVIRIRARTEIETDERTGKDTIIVTELPYQVNKAKLLEKIAQLVREKSIEGITDLRDESDRTGMRMVIELRRDMNAQVVLNHLYKRTFLETSFGINMLAIVAGQPRVLPLKEVLEHFIDFRRDVVTRRTLFELKKAQARMHILEALKRAVDMIDEVIRNIRASKDGEEARERLMELLEIDRIQSQAILDMRLQKLTGLEINKLVDEMDELQRFIDRQLEILNNESELLKVIRTELTEILDAYSTPRQTQILQISGDISIEDLIADEDEVVTLSHHGYVKRTLLAEYRTQKRGGKGLKGMGTKDEDFVADVWVTNTHAPLLIFTSLGKVYRIKVHELPAGSRSSRGKPIINLLPVEKEEKVVAIIPFNDFEEGRFIVTTTVQGLVKKTPLPAYKNINTSGIIAVNIPEGDALLYVGLAGAADRIQIASRNGQAITFQEVDARPMGRATRGVRGVRLREGDEAVSAIVMPFEELVAQGVLEEDQFAALSGAEDALEDDSAETEEVDGDDADDTAGDEELARTRLTVLTITENGYGKRTALKRYPVQRRGGLGVKTIKTSDRNGLVAGCRLVSNEDELIIITNGGKIIRTRCSEIPVLSRNTQGVRIINLETDEKVVGIARFAERDEDEDDDNGEGVEGATADGVEATGEDAGVTEILVDGEPLQTEGGATDDADDADAPDADE